MGATFPQLLLHHAATRPAAAALREKDLGIWQTLTWAELAALVGALAHGFAGAGLSRGQHLVVVGENRPRLYAAMLAAQALGAIPVPLYQDAVAEEFVFPLQLAEVGHAVVEDQEQLDKLLEIRPQVPALQHLWVDDPRGLRHYQEPGLEMLDALVARGAADHAHHPEWLSGQVAQTRPDAVAALFFTSGTTGKPKGVVHTHASLLDRAQVGKAFDGLTEHEEVLAYLPPAWIGQNIFSFAQWLACGYVVNCPESPSTVSIDLKEVGPTYYFAPPRVFEGLLTSVSIRMEDASAAKRWLYARCMAWAREIGPRRMAGESLGWVDRLRYQVGDWLIYGPLRNALGLSRVRVAYTAGEAIGPDLFTFFRSIGVNLKQLYGSTETAVFVCLQPDHEVRADTVGVPIAGVELKVAEGGEIWVRSAGLLQGYYKNPEATAEVLTQEGWYRTGDAGFLDAHGHLKIIDRAKDVGRLATGAMFAPKYIENKLKFFPQIKEAVAFGDGRDQVCVLLNIDFEAVGNWAERRGLPYAGYVDLAGKPEVLALMRDCVEQVNADLATDERLAGCQVARCLVLHKELDADDGELTRTRKVRRGYIAEKYAVLVDALYGGKSEQHIETQVRFEDGRVGSVAATLKILDTATYPVVKGAA
ncbi:AMP-dependent synthetase/ligase [Inhella gelatinilytica]|uniref:AMP-binding protein n=1 Tax=Inhella gelatinilytica TaxID=2795030 RepID=A0A931NDD4_9BURK|nr:AMP-binding protein [Inhella gelatinilytica]MBH9552484.1 AMP-binding protein [Inhella gelatinilytica]